MSIATQITRLQGLRDRIRTKLISLGLINSNSATLSDCTTAVESIGGTQYVTDAATAYDVAAKQYAKVDDRNLIPSNIVRGVSILGVVGTATAGGGSGNLTTVALLYGGAAAPHDLYPPSGYDGFSRVAVELTDANRVLTPYNVKSGVTIMGVTGTYETPTETASPTLTELKTAGVTDHSVNITPSQSSRHLSQVTIPRITNDIDSNIVAGNIKSGVTILGVAGSYHGTRIAYAEDTSGGSGTTKTIVFDVVGKVQSLVIVAMGYGNYETDETNRIMSVFVWFTPSGTVRGSYYLDSSQIMASTSSVTVQQQGTQLSVSVTVPNSAIDFKYDYTLYYVVS